LNYGAKEEEIFLGREIQRHKDYSEKTAEEIDEEIRKIVGMSMSRAEKILHDNMDLLHKLSKELLERESLDSSEIDIIINGGDLPAYSKDNGNGVDEAGEKMPEHVKKLLDQRKKESAPKDDSN
jgi:cell division protease FtsH